MFCSNCGKTVGPDARQCPHCHMDLGDVRFPGMPYTSVQFRIVPGTPMPIDEAYSYTRTSYSVNIADGEAPDPMVDDQNPDSATTYRPVLHDEDEEAYEEAPEAEAEAPVDVVDPDQLTEAQVDQVLQDMKEKSGFDADQLTRTEEYVESGEELTEEERAERVASYQAQQAEQPARPQRAKRKLPGFGRKRAESEMDDADEAYPQPADGGSIIQDAEAGAEGMEPGAEAYDAYGDGAEDYGGRTLDLHSVMNRTVAGIRVSMLLKIGGGLVAAVVCLVAGMMWFGYVNDAQQRSPIDGVSLSLYDSGLQAIQTNASAESRSSLLDTYVSGGPVAFTAQLQQQSDALTALMPMEPSANDQAFMQALSAIEENIANAATLDGMAGDSGSAESQARWAIVNQSIQSLQEATDVTHLQAIANGERIEVAVEQPTPSPTPVVYKTLTRGDEGEEVAKLQTRLYELGFLSEPADGKFGNKTTTAVKYFQMGHDLPVSSVADSATQELLFSDQAMDEPTARKAYQDRQNSATLAPSPTPAN